MSPGMARRLRVVLGRLTTCLLAIALVASLNGCARYYWSKPGSSAEQFDRESRECARESSPAPALGVVDGERYRACLVARGWVRDKQLEPAPPGWYRGIE